MNSGSLDGAPRLAPEAVSAPLADFIPGVDARTIDYLGSGCDFDVFVATDGWAFRFPHHADGEARLDRERQVLDCIVPYLSAEVAVPRIELLGEPTSEFPYRFGRHRYISGIAADAIESRLMPTFQHGLAAALSALHSIPEERACAFGIRELNVGEDRRRRWFQEMLNSARELRGVDPVVDSSLDWANDVSWSFPQYNGPLHVIHHDLGPEHVLVDPESGRVEGIIDWGDAMLGDIARDFVFLVTWRGWHFAEQITRLYRHPLDAGFRERLAFMARILSVLWLGAGGKTAPERT